jgi:prepilin-type N-terminal cleavage/methylation domain-containing protein
MFIKKCGFTLIELLIGITILVMVLTTVYASYNIGMKTFRKIEDRSYMSQNLRQSWRVLSRDLRCAFFSKTNAVTSFKGSADQVSFSTVSADLSAAHGNIVQVSYFIDNRADSAFKGLVRQEGPAKQAIAPFVVSLALKYYDGLTWKETWDAASLPVSVEIKAVLAGDDKTERTVATVAPVMCDGLY